ncbi:MAG TPA: PEFG-CTERM sorting domain-containing protein [Nitrosopumilaceae archaeon]|nr:PEFG-CTERM sorting domain-containing protein [Nitrosopumilaceae archaeon]
MRYVNRYHIIFASIAILGIVAIVPSSFADMFQVSIIPGSGPSKFCAETATCFNQSILNISPGDTVMWTNNDNVNHTLVNGLPYANQRGDIFDSGVIAPGKTYSFTFYNAGMYKYSDKIDRWMVGQVNVGPIQSSTVVPEFGPIAILVLAVSIVSTIVASKMIRIL